MDATPRPPTVPKLARWSDEDDEWILGDRDTQGRYHGRVRYWRPDGSLVCECMHSAGKPDGEAKRFHPNGEVSQLCTYRQGVLHGLRTWYASDAPTPEIFHLKGMSLAIRRAEVSYDEGTAASFRYFLSDGQEVGLDGRPLATRPPSVPPEAIWIADRKQWIASAWDVDHRPKGAVSIYSRTGRLLGRENHRDGRLDGTATLLYRDGRPRIEMTYRSGTLDGPMTTYDAHGRALRRAEIREARLLWIDELDPHGGATRAFAATADADADANSDADHSRRPSGIADDEAKLLERLARPGPDDDDQRRQRREAIDHLAYRPPSPAAMARSFALGWGGDEDREPHPARACRALVRRAAGSRLMETLRRFGLDRAPRIWTPQRLSQVLAGLAGDPSIDLAALRRELGDLPGSGRALALRQPGAPAIRVLQDALSGDSLNLQSMGLGRLCAEIARFASVRRVDLSRNHLTELPEAIGLLPLLARLDLTGNRIAALPTTLARLTELRNLHLAANALTSLPPGLTRQANLTSLGLGDNALRELSPEIADLSQLRTLWLQRNPLSSLPATLAELPHLRFLHLGDLPTPEPPAIVFELPAIEELWLASPHLERLPAAIADLSKLRRLILWHSSLRTLPPELLTMDHLVELRISGNPLPDGSIEELREALPGCKIY